MVEYSLVNLEITHGSSAAVWAEVFVAIGSGDEKAFHANVTFRIPLWPAPDETLASIGERAIELAKKVLSDPAQLIPREPPNPQQLTSRLRKLSD